VQIDLKELHLLLNAGSHLTDFCSSTLTKDTILQSHSFTAVIMAVIAIMVL